MLELVLAVLELLFVEKELPQLLSHAQARAWGSRRMLRWVLSSSPSVRVVELHGRA